MKPESRNYLEKAKQKPDRAERASEVAHEYFARARTFVAAIEILLESDRL